MAARAWLQLLVFAAAAATAGCASGPTQKPDAAETTDLLAAFEGVDIEQIVAAGDAAAAGRDYERALFIYTQALELEETADTWYRTGKVYRQMGDKSAAWQAFARALKLDPGHAGAHEQTGLLHLAMKQKEPAATHLQRAVELDPSRWRAHNALGVIADVEKNYQRSIYHYNEALKARPESALLLNNLGYSHYLAGNLTTAEQHFRMAIGIDPGYQPAHANLGLVQARRRNYADAVDVLGRVLDKAQAHNDVGFIAFNNGDLEEAAWLLTESIRLSPTYNETARQNLRQVREALEASDTERETAAAAGDTAESLQAPPGAVRIVQADTLNVRATASREALVLVQLQQDQRVEVMYEQNGWSFIEFFSPGRDDRQVGWVKSEFLQDS
jgi:tetratricopeptide (TPR) repeat protein